MTALLFALALHAAPAAAPAAPGQTEETIVGEVVDTTCFLIHEGRGPDHKECAQTCTRKGGSPAAILDEKSGRLVYGLAPMGEGMMKSHHTQRPDAKLLPFVGERVKVTGRVYERAGVKAIVLERVEAAGASAPAK